MPFVSTGALLNLIDICGLLAENPDTFHRLADMLKAEKLIAPNTSLAVKADKASAPYARASRMIQLAIGKAKQYQKKYKILVTILKEFKLRV